MPTDETEEKTEEEPLLEGQTVINGPRLLPPVELDE